MWMIMKICGNTVKQLYARGQQSKDDFAEMQFADGGSSRRAGAELRLFDVADEP